jgi:hypothetical protein
MPLDSNKPGDGAPDRFAALRRLHFMKLKLLALPKETERSGSQDIDFEIRAHLYVLFHKIYELHLHSSYMNKTQACNFIPFKHAISCLKYLELARSNSYVRFERDQVDTRKHIVKPTQALIDFIEREIDHFISETYKTIKAVDEGISKEKEKEELTKVAFDLWKPPPASAFETKAADRTIVRILPPIPVPPKQNSRTRNKKPSPDKVARAPIKRPRVRG